MRRDAYTTKDLTVRTWPDFVSLFSKGNGWDFCWCMHFQRPRTLPKGQWRRTRAERGVRNRRQKKELIEQGLAHGIPVYANGEPVGWCQYGSSEELSRIDTKKNYRELSLWAGAEKLWRITCFGREAPPSRCGSAALEAALESMRRKGGGVVEAYPFREKSFAERASADVGMLRRLAIHQRTER